MPRLRNKHRVACIRREFAALRHRSRQIPGRNRELGMELDRGSKPRHGSVAASVLFDPDGTSGPLPTHVVDGGTSRPAMRSTSTWCRWNGTSRSNTNAPFDAVTTRIVWNCLLIAVADELLWTWNGTV